MDKEHIKKACALFRFFFQTGCFTFGGGWSILAQMEREFVEKEKLITKEELVELAAVGKSLPGIMITNISMLFGYQICGWSGGIAAMLGITCPAVLILSVVAYGYGVLKDNFWCHCALRGIQAAVIPIIGSVAYSLGKEVFATRRGKIIGLITFFLCVFTEISNVVLILAGAVAALVCYRMRKNCR